MGELYARMFADALRAELARVEDDRSRSMFSPVYVADDGAVYVFRQLWTDHVGPYPTYAADLATPERVFDDEKRHVVTRAFFGVGGI